MAVKVSDIVMRRVVDGEIGIEVEAEFRNPPGWVPDMNIWREVGDGSLRFVGTEFVTRGPIPNDDKKIEHLRNLFGLFGDNVIKDSPRTSIHTHINVLNLTPVQVWTFVCGYFILENVLTKWGGPGRIGNVYCLRLKDAEGYLRYITNELANPTPFLGIDNDRTKYSGLNIGCIPRFGSIEIRTMRGWYDAEGIDEWTSALVYLRDKSIQFGSPDILMNTAWNEGGEIIYRLLPPGFVRKLQRAIPTWKPEIEEQGALVSQIAYQKDWDEYARGVEDRFAFLHRPAAERAEARLRAADWHDEEPPMMGDAE